MWWELQWNLKYRKSYSCDDRNHQSIRFHAKFHAKFYASTTIQSRFGVFGSYLSAPCFDELNRRMRRILGGSLNWLGASLIFWKISRISGFTKINDYTRVTPFLIQKSTVTRIITPKRIFGRHLDYIECLVRSQESPHAEINISF